MIDSPLPCNCSRRGLLPDKRSYRRSIKASLTWLNIPTAEKGCSSFGIGDFSSNYVEMDLLSDVTVSMDLEERGRDLF